jgi:ankyrin repeat protein
MLLLLVAFRLFGAAQSSTEALFRAFQTADSAAVRRLLEAGVNVNAKDADGTPALMAVTLKGEEHERHQNFHDLC